MKIKKMSAPLGAIIEDLDVNQVDATTAAELDKLFCEHHLLVFPNQTLSPEQHMAFAQNWGKLVKFPYGGLPDYPDIIVLKNNGKATDVNQHWHSDMTYNQAPPKLTMLYAHKAPEFGGDTAFSNQHLAYQELSDAFKERFADATALHSAEGLARLYGQDEKAAPRATHPLFRPHEVTGELALYACRAFTQQLTGWSKVESKAILEFLFEHSVRMEFQARHNWQAGDLVMWDNRSVLHYAVHDHGDDERVIHRLQVEGESTLGS